MTNITLIVDWTCIVLFVLGFIGNLLGLVVFSSRRFRCCSTYATLALTSFAINLFFIVRYSLLQHSSTRLWLTNNVVNIHWLACKVFRLSSSLRVLSAWVTVFWVIERFIYVSSRLNVLFHRGERYQLLEKYQYVCMACVSLLAAMIVCGPTTYFDAPVAIRSSHDGNFTLRCTYDVQSTPLKWQKYLTVNSFGWNYQTVRFLLSEIIPSILVALFNIGIIVCILRTTAHVRRRQEYHHNHVSMSITTGSTSKLPASNVYDTNLQRRASIRSCALKNPATPIANAPFGKMSWMNIILILHSILFFLSFTASSLSHFWTVGQKPVYAISTVILASCSLNFYVYCLSGKHFRTELRRIARRHTRNLYKKILRRCFKRDHRRDSTVPNEKEHIYQEVPHRPEYPAPQPRHYQTLERIR